MQISHQSPALTQLENRILASIETAVQASGQAPTIAEIASSLQLKSRGTVHRYVKSLIDKGCLERQGTGWRGLRVTGNCQVDPRWLERSTAAAGHRVGAAGKQSEGNLTNGNAIEGNATHSKPTHSKPNRSKSIPETAPVARLSDQQAAESAEPGADTSATPTHGWVPLADAANVRPDQYQIPLLGKIAAGLPIEAIHDEDHLDLAGFFIGPDRYALRVTGDSMVDDGILDGDTVIVKKQTTAKTGDIVVALIDAQEATLKRLGRVANGMVELVPANVNLQNMLYAANRVALQGIVVGQMRSY